MRAMVWAISWLLAVMALFAVGVVGNTGPPAIQTSNGIVSYQVLVYEAGKEVIPISPALMSSERGSIHLNTIDQLVVRSQQPTANWHGNTGGTAIPALIVRAVADQAIFAREPVPYWLRV